MLRPLRRGMPIVDVVFLNRRLQLVGGAWDGLIDTGAEQTAIPWKCRKLSGVARTRDLTTLGGFDPRVPRRKYPTYIVVLKTPSLGPVKLKVIAIPRRRTVLLGRDFLKGHVFAYDGPNGWFGLRRSARVGKSAKKLFDE